MLDWFLKRDAMKKVLIVGLIFPLSQRSSSNVLGSPRVSGLAKYLPEYGWEPVIVTMDSNSTQLRNIRAIQTPNADAFAPWKTLLRLSHDEDPRTQIKQRFGKISNKSLLDKMLNFGGAIIHYPDSYKGWRRYALDAANSLLDQEHIDVVMSSSPPVTAHVVAKELKLHYKIPWVADLRDLWSQNHNYMYGPLRRQLDSRLERRTLSSADALITVSQPLVNKLGQIHGNRIIHSITNGFDPDTVRSTSVEPTKTFTITHTGTIYQGKEDPTALLAAVKDLISDGVISASDIEVRFYGPRQEWLEADIKRYDLSGLVKQYGVIPIEQSIERQRESQVLLLLAWNDARERGLVSGKIFEYLAAKRRILVMGGSRDDVLAGLLAETESGTQVTTVDEVKVVLGQLYHEYKAKDAVSYQGREASIDRYSHRHMAQRFSEILGAISEDGSRLNRCN
jgi:glycosyltransferase involved in cell wall biosynthesis